MRPHDVDHSVPAEFRKIVSADDRVVVVAPHMIYTRLELNQIVDVRSAFCRPFHMADNAAERESSLGVATGQLLEHFQHPVLIEATVSKIYVGVRPKLELPALPDGGQINPSRGQLPQMTSILIRIDHMDRLVAAR
jgi:hypothetical protein